jgi:hypothetical protein
MKPGLCQPRLARLVIRQTCFGYRDGDNLWTHDGRHAGRFVRNEVYDRNGAYLGEIMSSNMSVADHLSSMV